MQVNKHGYLSGALVRNGVMTYTARRQTFKRTWESEQTEEEQQTGLNFTIERYADGEPGPFRQWEASGHITLQYDVKRGDEVAQPMQHEIALVVTHPNYGGQRWWFLCTGCGRRSRVLYLPLHGSSIIPECRQCLNLNYASQRQSYIERHKTYERHLLANWGYCWAQIAYHSMDRHYQPVTPELEHAKQVSRLQREMELLKHLIAYQRLLLKRYLHELGSLREPEDQRVYLELVVQEHGQAYAQDLVRMLGISIKIERDALQTSPEVLRSVCQEQALIEAVDECEQDSQDDQPTKKAPAIVELKTLIERKRELEQALKYLEKAA